MDVRAEGEAGVGDAAGDARDTNAVDMAVDVGDTATKSSAVAAAGAGEGEGEETLVAVMDALLNLSVYYWSHHRSRAHASHLSNDGSSYRSGARSNPDVV